jgi:hypothetical protein
MGEIFGLGLSHYPGPLVPAHHWPRMLEWNVEIGRIKPETFANKDKWPEGMRLEYGNDQGLGAAERHRDRLLAAYAKLRRDLDAFKPDLVVIWGDDQFENFKKDCIPAFCIGIFDEVVSKPFGGGIPFKTKENVWGYPPEKELVIKGHAQAATDMTRALIEQGFDLAYALEFKHKGGLAHSFNNTILYLDMDRSGYGFDYPIIPFHVNCYGNQLLNSAARAAGQASAQITPPSPSAPRCFEIGRATARFFADSPWRVALIASSSWSHGSLTSKHGKLYPDIDADRARLNDLKSGNLEAWGRLSYPDIEDSGQHEILNWVCLAGAMHELGQKIEIVDYVETYVFNSSKCFATAQPHARAAE